MLYLIMKFNVTSQRQLPVSQETFNRKYRNSDENSQNSKAFELFNDIKQAWCYYTPHSTPFSSPPKREKKKRKEEKEKGNGLNERSIGMAWRS